MGTLPYERANAARFFLNDFDSVVVENIETGLLFTQTDLKRTKARTCAAWLEGRGFPTRLLERRFDSHFRCQYDEPRLALCGFDSNPPRRERASAEFAHVIESGLGGTSNNFDTLSLHVLPNPRRVHKLWPDLSEEEEKRREAYQDRMGARERSVRSFRTRRMRPVRVRREIDRRSFCGGDRGLLRSRRGAPIIPRRPGLYRHQAALGNIRAALLTETLQLRP